MRVLVAGGGGFVGGAVVRALTAAGLAPVAGIRRAAAPAGVPAVCFDATVPEEVEAAAAGMDAIVNAVRGDAATMQAASRNLARAAARGGSPIIEISSMAVYGPAIGRVDEAAPLLATSRYGRAKRACEAEIRASGARAAILRPGIVYGPGSRDWIWRIGRLLRAGRLGDLGAGGDGHCNLVHAAELGAAVVALLRRDRDWGGAFNLATAHPPRWNGFFLRLARGIGAVPAARIGGFRLWIEARLLAPMLQAAQHCGAATPPLPPALLALFAQDIVLDVRRAAALDFPRIPLAAGIDGSALWFRGTGA